jgi:transcriptional regulator with XRE-family HTH domain
MSAPSTDMENCTPTALERMTWVELRKRSGFSQFSCAKAAGISRNKLCLAETGQTSLTTAEERAVRAALREYLFKRSKEFTQLQAMAPSPNSEQHAPK